MKCSECGKKIDHNSKYCCYCGGKQEYIVTPKKKPAPSDKKIVLVVVSILIVFFLLFLGFFITVGVLTFNEIENESSNVHPPVIEHYQGKEPILKRNYKKVHTSTVAGFDQLKPEETVTYLKQMGFSSVIQSTQKYDDECMYEIAAGSYPYEHFSGRDRIVVCYGKNQKITSLKVEFIFTAHDFSYEQAINEVLDASSTFHHLPLNQALMKDAYEELCEDMRNFEYDPSASREEMIDHLYEVEYELDYDDETRYTPALYTIELNIEMNEEI